MFLIISAWTHKCPAPGWLYSLPLAAASWVTTWCEPCHVSELLLLPWWSSWCPSSSGFGHQLLKWTHQINFCSTSVSWCYSCCLHMCQVLSLQITDLCLFMLLYLVLHSTSYWRGTAMIRPDWLTCGRWKNEKVWAMKKKIHSFLEQWFFQLSVTSRGDTLIAFELRSFTKKEEKKEKLETRTVLV